MLDTQVQVVDKLPAPSTTFISFDKDFSSHPGDLALRFRFDRDSEILGAEVLFSRVRAYRERAEPYCTAWHIEGYDRVVEVIDSSWVAELKAATNTPTASHWTMRHFLMYVDSMGAMEVVAADASLTQWI